MNRRSWRETTADRVRTGDTIVTDWSPRGLTLTVDYPTRDTFTAADGTRLDRIRFTGVDNFGMPVDDGWGVKAGDRVWVVTDAPLKRDVPGSGVFGALTP